MLTPKYLLLVSAIGLLIAAAAVLARDLCGVCRTYAPGNSDFPESEAGHWHATVAVAVLAWVPLLIAFSL